MVEPHHHSCPNNCLLSLLRYNHRWFIGPTPRCFRVIRESKEPCSSFPRGHGGPRWSRRSGSTSRLVRSVHKIRHLPRHAWGYFNHSPFPPDHIHWQGKTPRKHHSPHCGRSKCVFPFFFFFFFFSPLWTFHSILFSSFWSTFCSKFCKCSR